MFKELKEIISKDTIKEQQLNDIGCFLDRLYLANQLVYFYMYSHHEEEKNMRFERLDIEEKDYFDFIPEKWIDNRKLYNRWIFEKIASLRFNLRSNGGNCFVQQSDMDIIDALYEYTKQREEYKTEEEIKEYESYARSYSD